METVPPASTSAWMGPGGKWELPMLQVMSPEVGSAMKPCNEAS